MGVEDLIIRLASHRLQAGRQGSVSVQMGFKVSSAYDDVLVFTDTPTYRGQYQAQLKAYLGGASSEKPSRLIRTC